MLDNISAQVKLSYTRQGALGDIATQGINHPLVDFLSHNMAK
jgi:hypothetical protein